MIQIKRRPVPAENFLKELKLPPLIEKLFLSRGIKDPKQVQYRLQNLHRPHTLSGLKQASKLLHQAMLKDEKIVVVGDFDADGATSTALFIRAMRAFGFNHLDYLVPNRFEFGYGLTPELVPILLEMQADLIITVDNGISSVRGVDVAKQQGLQVIITDHHLPGDVLPAADAIVNPNLIDDQFPSKNLAGVGVVFYLLASLRSHLEDENWFKNKGLKAPNLAQWLDIVALGTVADLVSLDDNNRIFVTEGLRRIQAGHCIEGIKALVKIAGRDIEKSNTETFGFVLAPRLNAAGRLQDMGVGIDLLLTDNQAEAKSLAQELDEINQARKDIQADMQYLADSIIKQLDQVQRLPTGVCLYHKNWHQGVVGLLASKVKDKVHRPVIAFAPENEESDVLKGSARSIKGFHIRDALVEIHKQKPHLMKKFGGHAMAAGLSLQKDNYEDFRDTFDQFVKDSLTQEQLEHVVETDGELETLDLSMNVAEILNQFGPWGQNFPAPLFDGWFTVVDKREVGIGHCKMTLQTMDQRKKIEAIAFGIHPNQFQNEGGKNHLTYQLDINEFRGRRNLQLMIQNVIR